MSLLILAAMGQSQVEAEPAVVDQEGEGVAVVPPPVLLRRFHGSVELDATRLGRDAGRIADEVVQHSAGLVGAEMTAMLEMEAEIPTGAPGQVVRAVTGNCCMPKFETQGFEEE